MTAENDSEYAFIADEIKAYLKRFVHLDSEYKFDAIVLWIMHTHVRNSSEEIAFDSTPRLAILSDGPGSGKTRVLELISSLSYKGEVMVNPSQAGLTATINEEFGTPCIDEIDLLFRGNSQQGLRTILNAGYRRGTVIRHRNAKYETFAPIAMAGMAKSFVANEYLRPTVTRSIRVHIEQRPAGKVIEAFRERLHMPIANKLNRVLQYWGKNAANSLAMAWPELPEGVDDRNADIWSPLVAIAESLGERWTDKALKACASMVLSESVVDERPLTPTEQLQHDLALALANYNEEKITTENVIIKLSHINNDWNKFPNLRAASMELAALLAPLDIAPVKVRVDGQSVRGYWVAELRRALPSSDVPLFQPLETEGDDVE